MAHMTDATKDLPSLPKDPLEIAKELGIPIQYILKDISPDLLAHQKLPFSFALRHLILALSEDSDSVRLAMADPLDYKLQEQVRWRLGKRIEPVVVPTDILKIQIQKIYQSQDNQVERRVAKAEEISEGPLQFDLLEKSDAGPVELVLNRIFREAIAQKASDIHLEPTENGAIIRLRIDGVLQQKSFDIKGSEVALMTRVKVLAQMDIAERRLPQDGRIKVVYSGREIDFRVSSVPVAYGERLVLRVLDKGGGILNLNDLNIPSDITKELRSLSRFSEGIILVTGPTGSGKTTTLYSLISELPLDQVNVMTVEDPVEYKLSGIAQIGVHPKIGLTFAKGLRHILRQDPDVIMIGEIRDVETAQIALQASLTGHLVLSTLHTNDSLSAITRLTDMGIEPYLISASLVGVLAQRLARKICAHCKTAYAPCAKEIEDLACGPIELLFKGKGCQACFGTGYRGRIGVYELFKVNAMMRSLISKGSSLENLKKYAESSSLVPLRKAGAKLVVEGLTTLAEVLRITRGLED
jgi:general secretion pathway protein E